MGLHPYAELMAKNANFQRMFGGQS